MNAARSSFPSLGLLAAGAALLVFAARATLLHQGAGSAPFLDQWHLEADQIIVPWLEGRLSWTAFFAPHHEHYPVWTRLLTWLEVALLRTWDPLVQGTINAALFGAFTAAVTGWLARHFSKPTVLAAGAGLVALYALPHSWENAIWGLQSAVPLCLLLSFWHIQGSLQNPAGSRRWWLAQAAGIAALGSFGSAWVAPAATALVVLWTTPREVRRWLAPALLAAAGVVLLVLAVQAQPRAGALAQHAPDFVRFLGSAVRQAGWPSSAAFAGAVLYLPAFVLMLRLRGRRDADPLDGAILGLALFGLGQAAAFSFGRSADYVGFVSRYADFLALGVFANALAVWRLGAARLAPRGFVFLLALPWLGVVGTGLREINRTGHTQYFRENAGVWRQHRESALKNYLTTRDPQSLRSAEALAWLYPAPETVARALDTPGFSALLPAAVRASDAPQPGDAAGLAVRFLAGPLDQVLAAGGLLVLLGLLGRWPRRPETVRPAGPAPSSTGLALGTGLVCSAAVFLWSAPTEFDPETRLIRLVSTPDPVPDFTFRIVTPSPYPPDNLVGGAALWPEHFRNHFFGTHIDGPAFTGRAESSRFVLSSSHLLVPVAGFPATAGNDLRLEILDTDGRVVASRRYEGFNPAPVAFWSLDVAEFAGRTARLAIVDSQSSGPEAWIAVATPLPAPRDLGPERTAGWAGEQTASARISLGLFALFAFGAAAVSALAARQRRT